MNEPIEQARVGQYRDEIRKHASDLIGMAGRPPWPSHYISTTVNGNQTLEPYDPIDPEDVIAVFRTAWEGGIDHERKQTWKWLVLVAIVSFLAGGILI